ncbi:hypothetical protein [Nocardia sp. NPDC050406]|uniref:hypothetical protein n=1 Tax=Nocardia sp. NPDC050406 TaxID=3364318 RepID=UPI0037BC435E
MTTRPGDPDVEILADHSVLLAIPAFGPALIIVAVIVFIAVRDRRAERHDDTHSDNSTDTDKEN